MTIRPSRLYRLTLAALLGAAALLLPYGAAARLERLGFAGGPDGSAFQLVSNGIAVLISRAIVSVEVHDQASAGSLENLRRIESGAADFGVVYASDAFLGRHAKLMRDTTRYGKVMTVARLYGIPAHLVVRADSGIDDVARLAGKKIAVGLPGSGAAVAAQRYFEGLALWHKMQPQFVDTTRGMAALAAGRIDAAWVLAPAPHAAIVNTASSTRLRLLPLYQASLRGTLPTTHPYYSAATIPAGTYPGIEHAVQTVEDAALWAAGSHVDEGIVRAALERVYSGEGLDTMRTLAYATATMSPDNALQGVVTPLHAGARGYWTARGVSLPPLPLN
ncbi:MAG: TAXI family TRAP transporter solute-binding subunit [Rhodocyclales bacterium]|nr:TAXI family TRAP transporter solute-binding subunit [Rhodocyclales bacterium]